MTDWIPALLRDDSKPGRTYAVGLLVLVGFAAVLEYPYWNWPLTDLDVYLRASRDFLAGTDDLYRTGQSELPFTYPPVAVLFFVPFAALETHVSTLLLNILSLGALLLLTSRWLWLLSRRGVVAATWSVARLAALLAPLAMLLQPIEHTLSLGQVNLYLCAAIVWDAALPVTSRVRGIATGIAAGVKLTPGIFMVWFFITRQWRAFWTSVAAFLGSVAVGTVVLPNSSRTFWTDTIFNTTRVGGQGSSSNQSINGLLWRVLGPDPDRVWWLTLVTIVTVLAVPLMIVLHRAQQEHLSLLAAALWGLLISPISWDHHWVWVWPIILTMAASLLGGCPAHQWTRTARLTVASTLAVWLAAMLVATVFDVVMPRKGAPEADVSALGLVFTNAYPILGFVTLCLLAIECRIRVGKPAPDPNVTTTS